MEESPISLSDRTLACNPDTPVSGIVKTLKSGPDSLFNDSGVAVNSKLEDDGAVDKDAVDQNYPTGLKLATIMTALCLTVFCVALDNTVRQTFQSIVVPHNEPSRLSPPLSQA
jgi:hypothetical protein